jgi:ferritin-like metal-binding protein YciE
MISSFALYQENGLFPAWHVYGSTASTMKRTTSINVKNDNNDNSEEIDNDLHELFLDELSDLYSAEKQLTKALPKMVKAAQSDELKSAIQSHLEETEGHVDRLQKAFQSLGEKLKRKTCAAMEGLIEEASELLQEQEGKSSLDAAIIAAAQKVEHYEIASYGTVHAWAQQMGHGEVAELLQATLEEESAADEKLTEIAESLANATART